MAILYPAAFWPGQQIFTDLQGCGLRADFVRIDDKAALIVEGDAFIAEKFSEPEIARVASA